MVVTNQANIGRGHMTAAQLTAIHRRMIDDLWPARRALADVQCADSARIGRPRADQ
jgi:D-glycero-D-manno-heptose 1,7-bisphosphate phosphatase